MEEAVQNKVVLGYWAIRGLAERIRQLLQYLAIPYEEVRYEGPEGRAKWFNQTKPQLLGKNPALTLPYLIDGDKVVTESDAICIYLCHKAKKLELLGRNADEQVQLATAWGVYKDFHPNYIRIVYGDQPIEAVLKDFTERSHAYLVKFNGLLNNNSYICGGLTWIDFGLADFFQSLHLLSPEIFKDFEKLVEYQRRVWSLPETKAYFESNRFHERPCNNYTAKWY